MALEYMFFFGFGYLACYLAFYVRSKRNMPLHENDHSWYYYYGHNVNSYSCITFVFLDKLINRMLTSIS